MDNKASLKPGKLNNHLKKRTWNNPYKEINLNGLFHILIESIAHIFSSDP